MLVLLLLGVVVAAQGQGRGRSWKRGPLRLEDFGVVAFDGRQTSHLDYGLNYTSTGVTEGLNTYLYCRTAALMYPTASWMAEGHADTAELEYNQVLFDLVEVYRRQMQTEAMLLTKRAQYERLKAITLEQLEREMSAVQAATAGGQEAEVLERIRVKNREWLNAHPGTRPEFSPRRYWWTAGMDIGLAIPFGSIAKRYSISAGYETLRLGMGLGRHGLYYFAGSGAVQSSDSVESLYGPIGRTDITFGYGFTLFDRDLFSITPYVGLGVCEFDWWLGDSYTVGVMGNYNLHHWHRITNAVKHKAKRLTFAATGNLYLSYVNVSTDLKGFTLGLHVGLTFLSRNERVEWGPSED